MAESEISNAVIGISWSALLTAGLAYMGYNTRKRDELIDINTRSHTALELKVAENYATKTTVMALFQEATRNNEQAIGRVEKRIDETNAAILKQGDKIDKVADLVNTFQTSVMAELAKKT